MISTVITFILCILKMNFYSPNQIFKLKHLILIHNVILIILTTTSLKNINKTLTKLIVSPVQVT